MSSLLTIPDSLEIGSAESYPFAIDMTALLATGESADAPSCKLVDLADGSDYSSIGIVSGSVLTNGKLVQLAIHGLVAGHRYRLTTTCTPNGTSNKTPEAASYIYCPF